MRRAAFVAGLTVWVVGLIATGASGSPFDEAARLIMPLYADTDVRMRRCTAWHWREDLYVSAGHCTDAGAAWFRRDGVWTKARVVVAVGAFDRDAMIVQARQRPGGAVLRQGHAWPGETLVALGFGWGILRAAVCVQAGTLSPTKGEMRCSPPVRPGMSGSPVLDNRGRVVGIVTHTHAFGGPEAWYTYASVLHELWGLSQGVK